MPPMAVASPQVRQSEKEQIMKSKAVIKTIVRWGENGRKYVWKNPTQEVVNKLIKRYGCDQICDGTLWLQS
jgi:hypothetical protein